MSAHPVEIFCDYRILEEFFRGSLGIDVAWLLNQYLIIFAL
jgi:hypothetical protein